MQYRRFGKTNLRLSVFSLGTMRCLASEEVMLATVKQAITSGINHLETARGYGKSEQFLGSVLQNQQIPRAQLHITTKIPPTVTAAEMERSIDESLQRLGVDTIDCLALHGLNTWEHLEWVKSPQGCMQAIQQALADRRIQHIGFSTHGALEVILAAISTNFFEFVNLHYSLFFQRNAPAIDLAYQKGMGIFIISPADKGGMLYTPPEKLKTLCQPFSPLALNYRFLLSDRRITTLSIGAAKPEELETPLKTNLDGTLLPQERQVLEQLQIQQKMALGTDLCQQCYACLPCPEEIHIPEVLRLRNLAVAYDMTQFAQYRYGMFENAGHWFPGNKANRCNECGDCLPRCPENLPIPTLLQDAHAQLNGKPRRRLWQ
jgi:uncharacterized protein